ncbi:predicted protein [Chaetoceros tenuissimus]|uniref:G-protein coupled receptors family 1 profile domain-containing protein n=1 Tax=Chaetoceros tenuissimus TaxID=426638 RepID=A0AAD3HF28_9STRA|nr:predicted protein [Chaetoceros tenuissimus]
MDLTTMWKIGTSLQILMASGSFVASLGLAIMIVRTNGTRKKNKTREENQPDDQQGQSSSSSVLPWKIVRKHRRPEEKEGNLLSRIMFCIAISDVLQSLGILLGPFLVEKEKAEIALWAVGNRASCVFDGIIFLAGACWVPLFTASLALYYYCKMSKRMSNEQFVIRVGEWLIIFNLFFVLTILFVVVSTGALQTIETGVLCMIKPSHMIDSDNIYKGTMAVLKALSFIAIPVASMGVILISLSLLLREIYVKEQIFSSSKEEEQQQEQEQHFEDDASRIRQSLAKSYKQEMTSQVILYSAAFILCYLPWIASNFMYVLKKTPPNMLLFLLQAIFPSGGMFNILIFTRPATKVVRTKSNFQISRFKAFWIVFCNGGVVPDQDFRSDHDNVERNDEGFENELESE